MLEQSPSDVLSKTKRLRILTPTEMDDLYSRPELTEEERIWLFELNQAEQKILTSNSSNANKVDAIIRLGYFKKNQQFFSFNLDKVQADVSHVLQRYFEPPILDKNTIGREAKRKNQQWVLHITGHTLFDQKKHGQILLNKAKKLCRLSVNPIFIFQELLTEITKKKITRPGYSTLQKIISCSLVSEQKRISQIFKEHLSTLERSQLLSLFDQEENFYSITLLKQQPKNFKPTAIRQEILYYEKYQHLYQIAKRLLPLLGISKNGVAYYASLIEHYSVWSLNRKNSDQTCLWLICFILHRCQRMLDNLVTMFIYTANQYQDDVTKQAETLLLIHTLSPDEQKTALAKLIRVYTDKSINENLAFKRIKKMVYSTILPPERINQVANELDNQKKQKLYQSQFTWQAVDEFADTYRPLLRALSKVLILEGLQHKTLQKSYQFLQDSLKKGESISKIPYDKFPLQFIITKVSDFIYDSSKKTINTNRYEYECYQQVAYYINGRSLFVFDSINYQSLTAELLP